MTKIDKHPLDREFCRTLALPVPAAAAFDWHAREGAFERLAPPWEVIDVESRTGTIRDGDRLVMRMRLGPLRQRWIAEHCDYLEGRQFRDIQREGPFARWEHTHTIVPNGNEACTLEDRIVYRLPFGRLGRWLGSGFAERELNRLFQYRHRITRDDLVAHQQAGTPPMRILVSGSTGLVGSALIPFLATGGHQVVRLVRSPPKSGEPAILWNPQEGKLDAKDLESFDAVVHLAGENIAGGRWTAAQKARIRDSRVVGTKLLAEKLAGLSQPPATFLCASAIGFYGDRGDEVLRETSAPGSNFLADVCVEWEAAAEAARRAKLRVLHARFGVILSPRGGALAKMLTRYKLGAGGKLGSGKQWMSWIALDDVVGALHQMLVKPELAGPVNVVAPQAATNAEFTRVLGRVLSRPTIFPVPDFVARLAFGQMADELLLASTRVVPERLAATDFPFRFPDLEGALRHLLGRPLL